MTDPADDERRIREIAEAVIAAWRAFLDLNRDDKLLAAALLRERVETEIAMFERAQVERTH
jgi:hypothetical protein